MRSTSNLLPPSAAAGGSTIKMRPAWPWGQSGLKLQQAAHLELIKAPHEAPAQHSIAATAEAVVDTAQHATWGQHSMTQLRPQPLRNAPQQVLSNHQLLVGTVCGSCTAAPPAYPTQCCCADHMPGMCAHAEPTTIVFHANAWLPPLCTVLQRSLHRPNPPMVA
jgi:hypothetical protein